MTRRDNITRWRAKGLWMGRVSVVGGRATLNREVSNGLFLWGSLYPWKAATAVAYKTASWGGCGRHLSPGMSSKVATDGPFEAVLGKTHRTEF